MQFFTNEKEIRYYTTSIFCCETDSSFFLFCNVFVNAERNAFARAADLDSELEFSITDDTKKKFFFFIYTLYIYTKHTLPQLLYIFSVCIQQNLYISISYTFFVPFPYFFFTLVFSSIKYFFFLLFSFKCKFFHVLYGQKFSLLSYSEEEVKNFHCEAFFNRKNSLGFLS